MTAHLSEQSSAPGKPFQDSPTLAIRQDLLKYRNSMLGTLQMAIG